MSEGQEKGLLFVLSGPSGVGKDAVIERLKADHFNIYHVITATTRRVRPNEVHGVDYFFFETEEFRQMRMRNELLEWALVHDNLYGTPRQQVHDQLEQGSDVLLKIDVQGARQVKERVPNAVFIFLEPPSIEELVARLRQRGTETEAELLRRVQNAYIEMEAVKSYDYCVVNHHDRLDEAVRQIVCIIEAERCRVQRRAVSV